MTTAKRKSTLTAGLGPGQSLERPKPRVTKPLVERLSRALGSASAALREASKPGADLSGQDGEPWLAEALAEVTAEAGRLAARLGHATPIIAPRVTPPVTGRLCACGCGQPITSPRPEARYATGACRVRAHRAR